MNIRRLCIFSSFKQRSRSQVVLREHGNDLSHFFQSSFVVSRDPKTPEDDGEEYDGEDEEYDEEYVDEYVDDTPQTSPGREGVR